MPLLVFFSVAMTVLKYQEGTSILVNFGPAILLLLLLLGFSAGPEGLSGSFLIPPVDVYLPHYS